MGNVNIKLNSKGVQEMLKEVGSTVCMEIAETVQGRCGDGYVTEKRTYPERTTAVVRSDNSRAYHDNLKNNTLIKALGGSK